MASTPQDMHAALTDLHGLGDRPVAEQISILETVCAQLESTLHEAKD